MRKSIKERFENKFTITPGCWIWNSAKDRDGYGRIKVGGKLIFSHRLSFSIYIKEIPDGLLVCHACDNPSCVNPDHLWLGINKENDSDKRQKGRQTSTKGIKKTRRN